MLAAITLFGVFLGTQEQEMEAAGKQPPPDVPEASKSERPRWPREPWRMELAGGIGPEGALEMTTRYGLRALRHDDGALRYSVSIFAGGGLSTGEPRWGTPEDLGARVELVAAFAVERKDRWVGRAGRMKLHEPALRLDLAAATVTRETGREIDGTVTLQLEPYGGVYLRHTRFLAEDRGQTTVGLHLGMEPMKVVAAGVVTVGLIYLLAHADLCGDEERPGSMWCGG